MCDRLESVAILMAVYLCRVLSDLVTIFGENAFNRPKSLSHDLSLYIPVGLCLVCESDKYRFRCFSDNVTQRPPDNFHAEISQSAVFASEIEKKTSSLVSKSICRFINTKHTASFRRVPGEHETREGAAHKYPEATNPGAEEMGDRWALLMLPRPPEPRGVERFLRLPCRMSLCPSQNNH